MGLSRPQFFESWEDRPAHPLTGERAHYLWRKEVVVDGKVVITLTPKWRRGHLKRPDLRLSWFSPPEVGAMLGRTGRRIRQLCEEGKLQATYWNRRWYILGSSLPEFVKGQMAIAPLPAEMKEKKWNR